MPLTCKVSPQTFKVINDAFPLSGNLGRKVDIIASEVMRLRSSSPLDRRRSTAIEVFLKDESFHAWTDRKIAEHLCVSKSLVASVRSRMGIRRPSKILNPA